VPQKTPEQWLLLWHKVQFLLLFFIRCQKRQKLMIVTC